MVKVPNPGAGSLVSLIADSGVMSSIQANPILSCRLIADPGVVILIPAQPHTFVEIYHEIFSTVFLLLPLIRKGIMSITSTF